MRVLLSDSVDDLQHVLDVTNYPYKWTDPALHAALKLVGMDGPHLVAAAWLTETPLAPGWLHFHVAAFPDYRGRWLSRDVVEQMHAAARLCGACGVFTETPDGRWPLVRRLLRRYGYRGFGNVSYFPFEDACEFPVQLVRPEDQDTRGAPGATAAGTPGE
jgi:GNAT superfamily N-acetyltransferase